MAEGVAGYIYAFIVFTPLFILLVPIISALLLGLPMSPVAALYCAIKARQKGWNIGRYALAGTISSALFFWPWVYLVFRIHNRKVHLVFVRLFFVLMFIIWMVGPVGLHLLFGFLGFLASISGRDETDIKYFTAMYICIGIINLILWIIARKNFPNLSDIYDGPAENIIPDRKYIRPLVYAFAATSIGAIGAFGPSFFFGL